jgi:O-antigen/teichoic acid export membrane protein
MSSGDRVAAAMEALGVAPRRPTSGSLVRAMLGNATMTLALQAFSLGIGFITTIVLAHVLGATGYGRYAYSMAWASLLATPAILGFDRFLVRSIAVYEVDGEHGLARGLLGRTSTLVLAAGSGIAAAGCAVALGVIGEPLRLTFCLAMLTVPLTALTLVRQGAMQAIGRVVTGQLPEFLIRPLLALAAIGILYAAGSLSSSSAMAANVAAVGVAFAAGALMLWRALPAALRAARPSYRTRAWMRASLPMMLFAAVWFGNRYVATLVVGTIDGARSAGIYAAVDKGAELIVLVLVAANLPLAPVIARLYAKDDRIGLQHAVERVAQATLLASAPIALALALFPRFYLGLFGASFKTGATALTVLAGAQLVNSVCGPTGNALIMTGHERDAAAGIGVGLFANVLLSVLLVPPLGITGGAIASGSSLVMWNVILLVRVRKVLSINVTAVRRLAIR